MSNLETATRSDATASTTASYEALRSDAAGIDLTGRGLIRVTGEDRARLLHAMSTNDVQNLSPGQGVFVFFLTAQGRILGDATLLNAGDFLLLETEPELAPKLHAHLDKFIIADDVELADESSAWTVFGLEGPNAFARASEIGLPIPPNELGFERTGEAWVARLSVTSLPGLRFLIPPSDKGEWLQRFAQAGIPFASADEVNVVRLENGTPRYGADVTERYLVQETGILRAVHPRKGCYLGQEIVERVRSRAQVHRHLTPLAIEGNVPPAPGTKLASEERELGEITSAAYSPALNQVVALAYMRTEALEGSAALHVAGTEPPIAAHLRSSPSNRP